MVSLSSPEVSPANLFVYLLILPVVARLLTSEQKRMARHSGREKEVL